MIDCAKLIESTPELKQIFCKISFHETYKLSELVSPLLDKKYDLKNLNLNILQLAAAQGNTSVLSVLVHLHFKKGLMLALLLAAENGHLEAVKFILSHSTIKEKIRNDKIQELMRSYTPADWEIDKIVSLLQYDLKRGIHIIMNKNNQEVLANFNDFLDPDGYFGCVDYRKIGNGHEKEIHEWIAFFDFLVTEDVKQQKEKVVKLKAKYNVYHEPSLTIKLFSLLELVVRKGEVSHLQTVLNYDFEKKVSPEALELAIKNNRFDMVKILMPEFILTNQLIIKPELFDYILNNKNIEMLDYLFHYINLDDKKNTEKLNKQFNRIVSAQLQNISLFQVAIFRTINNLINSDNYYNAVEFSLLMNDEKNGDKEAWQLVAGYERACLEREALCLEKSLMELSCMRLPTHYRGMPLRLSEKVLLEALQRRDFAKLKFIYLEQFLLPQRRFSSACCNLFKALIKSGNFAAFNELFNCDVVVNAIPRKGFIEAIKKGNCSQKIFHTLINHETTRKHIASYCWPYGNKPLKLSEFGKNFFNLLTEKMAEGLRNLEFDYIYDPEHILEIIQTLPLTQKKFLLADCLNNETKLGRQFAPNLDALAKAKRLLNPLSSSVEQARSQGVYKLPSHTLFNTEAYYQEKQREFEIRLGSDEKDFYPL